MRNRGRARQAGCLIVLVVWIITFASDKHGVMAAKLVGPFRTEVESITLCPENRGDDKLNLTVKVYNDKNTLNRLLLDGEVGIGEPYDDKNSVIVRLVSGDGKGNFRTNSALVFRFKEVCKTSLAYAPKIVKSLAVSRFGEERICPFEAGSWKLHNYTLDYGLENVKHFAYGQWRGETEVLRNGRTWTCVRFLVNLLPL